MNSLRDPAVCGVLERLLREAKGDLWRFPFVLPRMAIGMAMGKPMSEVAGDGKLASLYIPLSREQGEFAYHLARAIGAKRIVEFGTSFGISTIYLTAAVRDNDGDRVIGTELEPVKHAAATKNLEEAGLADHAEVKLGDALVTLKDVEAPVDMVLLDGWKDLYIPIIKLLTPKLRPEAIVLADNIHHFKKTLRPYVEYVSSGENGFETVVMPIEGGMAFSRYIGH